MMLKSFNNSSFIISVFIDLINTFDIVDHNILLRKLFHYGKRGNTLNYRQSSLKNRRQQTVLENTKKSEYNNVKRGASQGPLLGPLISLLFFIFINDPCHSTPILEVIIYVDDTNLFYSHDVRELFQAMNAELKNRNVWFCANKLLLNTDKTKYI